jgi:hypothetical protein
MRLMLLLFFAVIFSWQNTLASSEVKMFSFKEKGKENYLIVHYDYDLIRFEECFRHNPCRFFGEIEVEDLNAFLRELSSDHSENVLNQASYISLLAVGSFLGFMMGEAALMMDREQIFNSSKLFIGTTVIPFMCAMIPMVLHEKARAYNTAMMLESKLYLCDHTMREVNLAKVRSSIDELIELLN